MESTVITRENYPQACYICWDTTSTKANPIRRDCGCRGSCGWVHVGCLIRFANSHCELMDSDLQRDTWTICNQCLQYYQGPTRRALLQTLFLDHSWPQIKIYVYWLGGKLCEGAVGFLFGTFIGFLLMFWEPLCKFITAWFNCDYWMSHDARFILILIAVVSAAVLYKLFLLCREGIQEILIWILAFTASFHIFSIVEPFCGLTFCWILLSTGYALIQAEERGRIKPDVRNILSMVFEACIWFIFLISLNATVSYCILGVMHW